MPTVGVDKACSHHNTADVYSAGGDLIGGDCRGCGKRYGIAVCTGCNTSKKVWIAVDARDDVQRFCSEDCLQQYRNRRSKGTARTVGGSRGRK